MTETCGIGDDLYEAFESLTLAESIQWNLHSALQRVTEVFVILLIIVIMLINTFYVPWYLNEY